MKINRITANNIFGLINIDLDTHVPVQLIAGLNGAGKSSIQNAVRLALTGEPSRVFLKKNYSMMVHEGCKKGKITVQVDDDILRVDLPKGKIIPIDNDMLPYVLTPSTFAALKADERRKFLFELMGVKIDRAGVKEQLLKTGADEDLVDSLLPLLRAGFPAACEEAKNRAKEAKADWKATTGEAYGSDKAEDWEPEIVHFDQDLLQEKANQMTAIDKQLAQAHARTGELNAITHQIENYEQRATFLREKASKETRYQCAVESAAKLIADQESMLDKVRKMAGAVREEDILECPCCSELLMIVDGDLHKFTGIKSDDNTTWDIPKHEAALQGLITGLKNHERSLAEAQAAAIELESLEPAEQPSQEEEFTLKSEIEGLSAMRGDLQAELSELENQSRLSKQWEITRKKAEAHHDSVVAHLNIAEQLSPSGIPSQLLSKSVKPFNKRLKASSDATGWKFPRVTPDFEIEADGRPYCLLSEAEQWRSDAMLAEAISYLSGLKLIMLDRMDVLDIASRGVLIDWMYALAETDEIDTALIFATLKALPPDDEYLHCEWLEEGSITQQSEEAA